MKWCMFRWPDENTLATKVLAYFVWLETKGRLGGSLHQKFSWQNILIDSVFFRCWYFSVTTLNSAAAILFRQIWKALWSQLPSLMPHSFWPVFNILLSIPNHSKYSLIFHLFALNWVVERTFPISPPFISRVPVYQILVYTDTQNAFHAELGTIIDSDKLISFATTHSGFSSRKSLMIQWSLSPHLTSR